MLTDKFISVVVACYRDAGSVDELLKRLDAAMADVTPNWEVIYVNDCSPDNAEQVLLAHTKNNPRLTLISHARNFGAQTAFSTGLKQARGDAVVIMDGDLQDPPEMIVDFVKLWLQGNDVVYGIRAKRSESLARNAGYKIFYRIFNKIAYIPIPLDAGEFSLMDRVVVEVIIECREYDRLIRGLRAYAGFKQIGVEFVRPPRFSGKSTQSMLDYIMWAYKSFTSYSLAPLRFITSMAFAIMGILLFLLLFYIVSYLLRPVTPRGYMTTLILLLSLGMVIMLSLGIIGEYLGRLFIEVKDRPQQVISRLVNDHRDEPRKWLGRTEDRVADRPANCSPDKSETS